MNTFLQYLIFIVSTAFITFMLSSIVGFNQVTDTIFGGYIVGLITYTIIYFYLERKIDLKKYIEISPNKKVGFVILCIFIILGNIYALHDIYIMEDINMTFVIISIVVQTLITQLLIRKMIPEYRDIFLREIKNTD
jgi:nitrate reductase gamma subunit